MGGANSRPTSLNFRQHMEKKVNQNFSQNCQVKSDCTQGMEFKSLKIEASDNCNVSITNQCKQTGKATCKMSSIVGNMVDDLKKQDPDFIDRVGRQFSRRGKPLFTNANVNDVKLEDIEQAISQKCGANSANYQSIQSGDTWIKCSDQSTVEIGNKAIHEGSCMTNLLNSVIDDMTEDIKDIHTTDVITEDDSNDSNKKDNTKDIIIVIMLVVLLLLLLVKIKK